VLPPPPAQPDRHCPAAPSRPVASQRTCGKCPAPALPLGLHQSGAAACCLSCSSQWHSCHPGQQSEQPCKQGDLAAHWLSSSAQDGRGAAPPLCYAGCTQIKEATRAGILALARCDQLSTNLLACFSEDSLCQRFFVWSAHMSNNLNGPSGRRDFFDSLVLAPRAIRHHTCNNRKARCIGKQSSISILRCRSSDPSSMSQRSLSLYCSR